MGITLPSLSLSDNAVNEMSQSLIPDSNQPNQNYTSWYPGIENDLQEKKYSSISLISLRHGASHARQMNLQHFQKKTFKDYIVENNITYIKADWTNRNDQISEALLSYKRSGAFVRVLEAQV